MTDAIRAEFGILVVMVQNMNTRRLFVFGCMSLLFVSLGCHNDGMTSEQRFALQQQQSRELHEQMMAKHQTGADLMAKRMDMDQTPKPSTAPAAP